MEKLIQTDREIFQMINGANSPSLDIFMFGISLPWTWMPLYILIAYWIFKQFGWRQLLLALSVVALLILCTDVISSTWIKPGFARLRPCQYGSPFEGQVHLVYGHCGGLYGFISAHAANFFGLTSFIFIAFREQSRTWTLIFLFSSILVSYSRVYAGVHYPADVLGGAIWGILWGIIFGFAFRKLSKQPFMNESKQG